MVILGFELHLGRALIRMEEDDGIIAALRFDLKDLLSVALDEIAEQNIRRRQLWTAQS